MKKVASIITVVVLLAMTGGIALAEGAPQSVKDLSLSLAEIGKDPVIVKAVTAQNAERKSLSAIQEMDAKWKNTPGVVGFMKELMESECGRYLSTIRNSEQYFTEIFVMDNQGANVCLSDKTSDYWQGDEAKFKKSYKSGNGSIFVDDVEFDDSSQAYISQVSIPVLDDGKVVGAITFGIDVENVQ